MAAKSDTKAALKQARKIIEDVHRDDGNEAETRRRVERIFESVAGYDAFEHLSREHAVHGSGDTEHMDFAITVAPDDVAMVVELKRVSIDLSKKHLKQASRYAIDMGCEWVLLTNGREWELYHVEFGQPPETRLIRKWNLLRDDWADLEDAFELISFKSLKKGALAKLWEKQSALTPECLLAQLLSESMLRSLKNAFRREAGVTIHPEDIVAAIRKLLNDHAGGLMDQMKISLPERSSTRQRKTTTKDNDEKPCENAEKNKVDQSFIPDASDVSPGHQAGHYGRWCGRLAPAPAPPCVCHASPCRVRRMGSRAGRSGPYQPADDHHLRPAR